MSSPIALTVACLAFVAALLVADRLGSQLQQALAKLGASTCFVLVALSLGAPGSRYGQLVLGGLVLGWFGDALLLSRRSTVFMAGLGAFLLAHIAYAAAFLSGPWSRPAAAAAVAAAFVFGWVVLRWLHPHIPASFKGPVLAYVLVILAMCVSAAGYSHATGRWYVLAGAVLFAASDISVARDRFVQPTYGNRLWGRPTYFVAQLLLAWSVHSAVTAYA